MTDTVWTDADSLTDGWASGSAPSNSCTASGSLSDGWGATASLSDSWSEGSALSDGWYVISWTSTPVTISVTFGGVAATFGGEDATW